MTTIDDFLPDDLAVDLVKIDVEGHEPYVLMGMERTIARSPDIRIVIEYIDALLAQTTGAPEFADYIRGLGFGICEIGKDWRLRPCPPGERLPPNTYLLLTRTPEADIAAAARRRLYPRAALKRFLQRRVGRDRGIGAPVVKALTRRRWRAGSSLSRKRAREV